MIILLTVVNIAFNISNNKIIPMIIKSFGQCSLKKAIIAFLMYSKLSFLLLVLENLSLNIYHYLCHHHFPYHLNDDL